MAAGEQARPGGAAGGSPDPRPVGPTRPPAPPSTPDPAGPEAPRAAATAMDREEPVDPGVTRPALWPPAAPGAQPRAFDRERAEERPLASGPAERKRSWLAVGLLLAAALLVAGGAAAPSWWPVAAGAVVGLAGAVLALRARIFAAVSTGQSPRGPGARKGQG